MGRFWFGICLLVLFLVLGLWVANTVGEASDQICKNLEQASLSALSGDLETGKQLALQAKTDWEDRWHKTAAVADHAPMDEIDGLFGQLSVYEKAGQTMDFAACCARLSKLVAAVGEAHSLTWWNLL